MAADLHSSMTTLSIGSSSAKAGSRPSAVSDSWEDSEDDLSDEEGAASPSTSKAALGRPKTADYPAPPPPTPSSPRFALPHDFNRPLGSNPSNDGLGRESAGLGRSNDAGTHNARPEKTTSTASRMIAAGLGVKAPKRTDEQRQYDKAMRDKERRTRDAEKDAKRREEEAREKAKRAMWDD